MKRFLHIMLAVGFAIVALGANAQQQTITRAEYIEQYAPLAVEQQMLYGIPASITLAQGLLESGNGNSRLAREANNHFGIKCGSSWDGESIRHDDDAAQECFRAYSSVEESYIDHSLILLERKWYRPLFDLDPKDYKAWAHGLKKAGYATNPLYAELLIKIIEDNQLYKYDNALLSDWQSDKQEESTAPDTKEATAEVVEEVAAEPEPQKPQRVDVDNLRVALHSVGGYGVFSEGGRRYVVAAEGDNLARVAKAVGVSERRLRRINGFDKERTIFADERIFIE
ncbi:MAG: glucosaminidase domain-containing protein [Tidjanibacter sp.]|nr:glucosaminidase domain-containing protein [Tidjanibacter sp.]